MTSIDMKKKKAQNENDFTLYQVQQETKKCFEQEKLVFPRDEHTNWLSQMFSPENIHMWHYTDWVG